MNDRRRVCLVGVRREEWRGERTERRTVKARHGKIWEGKAFAYGWRGWGEKTRAVRRRDRDGGQVVDI